SSVRGAAPNQSNCQAAKSARSSATVTSWLSEVTASGQAFVELDLANVAGKFFPQSPTDAHSIAGRTKRTCPARMLLFESLFHPRNLSVVVFHIVAMLPSASPRRTV